MDVCVTLSTLKFVCNCKLQYVFISTENDYKQLNCLFFYVINKNEGERTTKIGTQEKSKVYERVILVQKMYNQNERKRNAVEKIHRTWVH